MARPAVPATVHLRMRFLELRRRRDELEDEEEQLDKDVARLRAQLGMGPEQWILWPTVRRTAPLMLLGLGAWFLLDGWFGLGRLLKALVGL